MLTQKFRISTGVICCYTKYSTLPNCEAKSRLAYIYKLPLIDIKRNRINKQLHLFVNTKNDLELKMASNTLPNGLRDINRFITTHNKAGESVYSNSIPPTAKWQEIGGVVKFFLGYTTHKFPASLDPKEGEDTKPTPEDIENYSKELENPGGLSHSTGKPLPRLQEN